MMKQRVQELVEDEIGGKIIFSIVSRLSLFPIHQLTYTQSVLIRNGPIRSTSEILAFFKKTPVELSKLRNGEITFQIFKKCTSESFQFKKWSRIPVSRSIS